LTSHSTDGTDLPCGWEEFAENSQRFYYVNKLTNESQWGKPDAPAHTKRDENVEISLLDDGVEDVAPEDREVTYVSADGIRVYAYNKKDDEDVTAALHPPSPAPSPHPGGKKVVKEVSYVFDGIRVYTTREVDDDAKEQVKVAEAADEAADSKNEHLNMAKEIAYSMDLQDKISRTYMTGNLLKQGKYFGSWKKLYFVLSGNSLCHYESKQSFRCGAPPTKIVALTGLSCLSYTKFNMCFVVHTGGRTSWTMMAENKKQFVQWLDALNTVIGALFDTRIQGLLRKDGRRWKNDAPELF
jgi:hypothetical protein